MTRAALDRSDLTGAVVFALAVAVSALVARPARGLETLDGTLRLHGFARSELRVLNDGFERKHHWYVGQFAQTLNLELEWDLAPDGWGPFDSIGAYARVEARFDCVWTDGCGVFNSRQYFGDEAEDAPYKALADGRMSEKSGTQVWRPYQSRAHNGRELLVFWDAPSFEPLLGLGRTGLARTFADLDVLPLIAAKQIDGAFDERTWTLGPWNREAKVRSLGSLRSIPSITPPLPTRPAPPAPGEGARSFDAAQGMWIPHANLRRHLGSLDDTGRSFDLRESDLRWNHGASQDEGELKEAYLDLELLDERLFVRVGKQTIVWGKTELFRNQDQFNPQDVGLSSLPTLEESRVALWSVRAILSLYDVGPLDDVRLELAAILDRFEPIDIGTCGEPYAIFLVCAGSFGFVSHGWNGLGIAGVDLPPHPWNSWKGLEIGGRLEFRWRRLSFAITDYYGYSDIPTVKRLGQYERKVDPRTGRPLDVRGRRFRLDDPGELRDQALRHHPLNRQLFEFACSVSFGVAGQFIPELANDCAISVFNNRIPLAQDTGFGVLATVADSFALVIAGSTLGETVLSGFATGTPLIPAPDLLVHLNPDVNDGPAPPPSVLCSQPLFVGLGACLSQVLSDEQEALLGCGPFYGTNCDLDGIDFFQAEASVLFQALPNIPDDAPVGTRYVEGKTFILPGARGPGDPGYDPRVDGCIDPDDHPLCARFGVRKLVHAPTRRTFHSEMEVLSFNLLQLLVAFGAGNDPGCDPADPVTCEFVRGILATTGVQRADVRAGGNGIFGRLDFIWAAGAPLKIQFNKRNVLGFALDFAEDRSKTNWSVELTWVENDTLAVTTRRDGFRKLDIYNLTISMDRPTFINFLNQNRTFVFNTQWFLRYIPEYQRQNVFAANGPLSVLATLTVFTGYFQDRLLIGATLVHDFASASGAILWSTSYRFTARFSAEVTLRAFYGGPEDTIQPLFPERLQHDYGDFKQRTAYHGLSLLAERDEVGLALRYTF